MAIEAPEPPIIGGGPPRTGSSAAPPQHHLARFWDLVPALLGVGDYDGNTLYVNPAYPTLLGWSVEELTSVPWWEFLHPDERDELAGAAHWLMEDGGTRCEQRIRVLCRDGSYRWIQWSTAVDAGHRIFYAIGIDLGRSEADGSRVRVGTWTWHAREQTLTLSPELLGLLAPGAETMTPGAFLERVLPEDRVRLELRALDAQTTGERFSEDFRVHAVDGTIRWLHAAASSNRRSNRRGSILRGIAVDITDRRTDGRL